MCSCEIKIYPRKALKLFWIPHIYTQDTKNDSIIIERITDFDRATPGFVASKMIQMNS